MREASPARSVAEGASKARVTNPVRDCSVAPLRPSCKTILTLRVRIGSERPPPQRPARLAHPHMRPAQSRQTQNAFHDSACRDLCNLPRQARLLARISLNSTSLTRREPGESSPWLRRRPIDPKWLWPGYLLRLIHAHKPVKATAQQPPVLLRFP